VSGRIYVTDCEGPLTRNDNAQELAERFIPDGAAFFTRLSRYDDFLADVARKPGYNAGDTLRLLPPFLRAFEVSDQDVEEFSREQVLLVPDALKALDAIAARLPVFIVSTSYTPYLKVLCTLAGIPMERVRCTELSLDAWRMPEDEKVWLRERAARVIEHAPIAYPDEATTAAGGHGALEAPEAPVAGEPAGPSSTGGWQSPDTALEWLTEPDRKTVRELDALFWRDLREREVSAALVEAVRPVGGRAKLDALRDIMRAGEVDGADVMYVGDSITDVPPLAAVRSWRGAALSFNGNGYALAAAEFAAASPDAEVAAQLAAAFADGGRDAVAAAVRAWPKAKPGARSRGRARARVGIVAEEPEALAEASAAARRKVRGVRAAGGG
jgi:predicted HAD superfamily phosphohydrolase